MNNQEDPWLRIWEQIGDANLADDRDYRRDELNAAIEELERLHQSGQKWTIYPLGYAYYCHPDRRPGTPQWTRCEAYLLQAIAENIEPDLSRLRLAYHRYDANRYAEADQLIKQIDMAKLDEGMAINATELQLCSRLHFVPQPEYAELLEQFAHYMQSRNDLAIPPLLLESVLLKLAEEKKLTGCQLALQQLDAAFPISGDHWFRDLLT